MSVENEYSKKTKVEYGERSKDVILKTLQFFLHN